MKWYETKHNLTGIRLFIEFTKISKAVNKNLILEKRALKTEYVKQTNKLQKNNNKSTRSHQKQCTKNKLFNADQLIHSKVS